MKSTSARVILAGVVGLSACALPSVHAQASATTRPAAPVAPATAPAPAPAAAAGPTTAPVVVELALSEKVLDLDHLRASRMGYMPASLRLADEKPAALIREPAYRGKPLYGGIRLGNGPRALTYLAVDEAPGQVGRLYIDLNQNGDLTDDGPAEWAQSKEVDGVLNYMTTVTLHASWGSPVKEEDGGSYTLLMYKRDGARGGGYAKLTGRAGKLEFGGKTYDVVLAENTNDALFTVPATGDLTRRPVELYIDLDADGTFKGAKRTVDGKELLFPERLKIAEPVEIEGAWYLIRPSVSGAKLTVTAVPAPNGAAAPKQAATEIVRAPAIGEPAPDFTVFRPDGSPVKLSDYRGKVVVLDFWATWCGPCIASMPGLQRVYDGVKDQGVVVFSANVFDQKDPFDAWIAKNSGTKYSFDFAFDPAGRGKDSVASGKYGVTGIPTMYIVDRDGKVAARLVGSGNEEKLTAALEQLGIKAPAH